MEYFIIFLGLILLGCFSGLMAGLLGIGGGLVVVPGLAFLFQYMAVPQEHLMQMAVGTSLAIMIPTTLRALLLHLRQKAQVWPVYSRMAIAVIIGALIGAFLAHIISTRVLQILFGFFVLYMAFRLWFTREDLTQPSQIPSLSKINTLGVIAGIQSGLLGIGGGVLTIPFLVRWGVAIRDAIAISNAVSLNVAIIGAMSFMISGLWVTGLPAWATGYIVWSAWLPVSIASVCVAPFGVKWSYRLPPLLLKRIFSVLLIIVAVQMLKVLI